MTDIHTHILPCIDDGSGSAEESRSLLALLKNQGVDTVVLTPHYYGRDRGVDLFLKERQSAAAVLADVCPEGIRTVLACECNIDTCANSNFEELRPLAIDGTRYILTELSFVPLWQDRLRQRLRRLTATGMVPVIAHVELYPAVQKQPQLVLELINSGCLIQINCDSLLDDRLYPLVRALLLHGQVHCIGSDTHNLSSRPPKYADAVHKIISDFGTDFSDALQNNMRNILADSPVPTPVRFDATPVKHSFFHKYL